jgi:hypothetical protein
MMQRRACVLLSILLLPLLSGLFTPSSGFASAAIDDCQGDLSPIVWNETISRHAQVPHHSKWMSYYDDDWDDEGRKGGKNPESSPEPFNGFI